MRTRMLASLLCSDGCRLITGWAPASSQCRDLLFTYHFLQGELANALNLIFEPSGDPGVFVFDFAIKTTSFKQELLETVAMNTLNAVIDGGEADNVPLATGFPFPGTSHYELAYNAITGDLDLNAA